MKLASYMVGNRPSFGAVTADGVITMNDRISARIGTLK